MITLKSLLIAHEGLRLKPYRDTVGKLTIGVGRNLEDRGITEEEAMMMLDNDIKACQEQASRAFVWFDDLDQVRKDVIVSLIFNMGLGGFNRFKKMHQALEKGDMETAAAELMLSMYAKQVGQRAVYLSSMIRSGNYPAGYSYERNPTKKA